MLQAERTEDPQEALRLALQGWQSEIWTAMPGILESYDATKGTCVVQPAIQGIFRLKDGTTKIVTIPQCLDVPIHFPGGGGVTLTFPMVKGDEGLLVFASRCIDAWWQSGDVQPQAEIRMHSLSDGFFFPGFRSQPRKLANVSTDSTQLRADDGTYYVELKAAQLTLKHPTKVVVDSPEAHFTGKITTDGDITSQGTVKGVVDVIADTISGKNHTHSDPQGGNTGPPNP